MSKANLENHVRLCSHKLVKQLYTPKMMMMINLEKTLIAKEEKSYENSLSEAKDTVSRWYNDTASGVTENTGWPGQIPVLPVDKFKLEVKLEKTSFISNRQKA